MFGGIAFFLAGKMCCGVLEDRLVARLGAGECKRALGKPHVRPMDVTGRPMKGYVYVGPGGLRTRASLRAWVEKSLAFVATLPRNT